MICDTFKFTSKIAEGIAVFNVFCGFGVFILNFLNYFSVREASFILVSFKPGF